MLVEEVAIFLELSPIGLNACAHVGFPTAFLPLLHFGFCHGEPEESTEVGTWWTSNQQLWLFFALKGLKELFVFRS